MGANRSTPDCTRVSQATEFATSVISQGDPFVVADLDASTPWVIAEGFVNFAVSAWYEHHGVGSLMHDDNPVMCENDVR